MSEHGTEGKRPLWIAVAALVLGAAALWGSSRLAWLELRQPTGGDTLGGSHFASWLVPLAVLALAAVAAALALHGTLRRLLGGLLAVAGIVAVVLTISTLAGDMAWFGYAPGGPPVRAWAGPAAAIAGGVLVVAAGVLLVWRGHVAPRMGAKYSAPGAQRNGRDPDTDLWNALSEGEDPTTRG